MDNATIARILEELSTVVASVDVDYDDDSRPDVYGTLSNLRNALRWRAREYRDGVAQWNPAPPTAAAATGDGE